MAVTLVCGPPCVGKSTYVQAHMKPGDLVVDYDAIAQSLGSPVSHRHHFKYHRATEQRFQSWCAQIADGQHAAAWVIRSLPDPAERQRWAEWLSAEVVLLDEDDTVLRSRALDRRDARGTAVAISQWRQASRPRWPF